MKTLINGSYAPWTKEIIQKWQRFISSFDKPFNVTMVNYFTPRPYANEYDKGSNKEGFTYTINDRHVCWVNIC